MRISSYKSRSLAQRDSLSFCGLFTFDNITGYSELGFSGDTVFPFIFSGGRFLDPEGNYTYNYSPDENILISGNFSASNYNYWVNDEYVAFYPKSSGNFDSFYFNTNIAFDVNLSIMSAAQDYSLAYPSTFNTGNPFSFALVNNTPDYTFKIFSGTLTVDNAFSSVFDYETGFFPAMVGTGVNLVLNDFGAERGAIYNLGYTLFTNHGNITGAFSVVDDIPTYFSEFNLNNLNNSGNANFFYDSGDATDLSSLTDNTFKYGNFSLDYTIDTTGVSKSLYIELINSGGNTGSYLAPFVTGITITNSGFGYSSAPTISFAGGGGAGAAATSTLNGGYIASINFTSFGSGYTSAPTVTFNGGSPTYSGSGVAILSGYSKTLFNTWNLYTGTTNANLVTVPTGISSYIYNGVSTTNSLLFTVSCRNWWDTDATYTRLLVSGIDTFEDFMISGGYTV